ncbi:hypothetical protein AVEN_126596-1 [Araneus ventricosus]|uniref:Uncharacterized protein n=1 Tax=Araneus ventricosus TaxID=182803 RepID=A0A4Y2D1J5_ARAVE|nr:hypothetical protein AVEN_97981-1 [Araneus ventricosus]GBM10115.1 hypothetical protein AVEN_212415-1 [Araneus ventricosus]GBM21578.1 hypothetical protein AVEN_50928-1 [Araneus ventricosus]GBM21676.1 hypothetical protein AVEN_126596-1 [Araneus ventricosus]
MQLNPLLVLGEDDEKAKPNNHLLPGEQRYRVYGELVKVCHVAKRGFHSKGFIPQQLLLMAPFPAAEGEKEKNISRVLSRANNFFFLLLLCLTRTVFAPSFVFG